MGWQPLVASPNPAARKAVAQCHRSAHEARGNKRRAPAAQALSGGFRGFRHRRLRPAPRDIGATAAMQGCLRTSRAIHVGGAGVGEAGKPQHGRKGGVAGDLTGNSCRQSSASCVSRRSRRPEGPIGALTVGDRSRSAPSQEGGGCRRCEMMKLGPPRFVH